MKSLKKRLVLSALFLVTGSNEAAWYSSWSDFGGSLKSLGGKIVSKIGDKWANATVNQKMGTVAAGCLLVGAAAVYYVRKLGEEDRVNLARGRIEAQGQNIDMERYKQLIESQRLAIINLRNRYIAQENIAHEHVAKSASRQGEIMRLQQEIDRLQSLIDGIPSSVALLNAVGDWASDGDLASILQAASGTSGGV